jgi:hypothetical protein
MLYCGIRVVYSGMHAQSFTHFVNLGKMKLIEAPDISGPCIGGSANRNFIAISIIGGDGRIRPPAPCGAIQRFVEL